MDSNILAVGISAIVSLMVAVGTSIYTTRKNIKLEKEMYFRKTKIEDIDLLLDSITEYMKFYSLESERVSSLLDGKVTLEKLNTYSEDIKKVTSYDAIDFTKGNVNIPYDSDENRVLEQVKLFDLDEKFYSSFCATNFMIKNLYLRWNFEEDISTDSRQRVIECMGLINSTSIICMKLQIVLEGLRKYNLSKMKGSQKKGYSKDIINEIKGRYNLYGF
ncbi:MAG: hypothetical protein MR285_03170 [Peptoniphilus sp.]|uniref:hypothetical protein n=1 Tax=Peptoniphilus sp. TaxID=1971214 RepID=UPI0025ECB7EB|nr:hypothetical protein [Peptoniphilus sp.]MCI5643094.1 hypothetical protein [Peptoniphilus sp.]MDD7353304.1 hypothetical protein [Peptoniphilaceae bacterium]MDY3903549.1 hypothetical protein [Peptoniphilus sp.]